MKFYQFEVIKNCTYKGTFFWMSLIKPPKIRPPDYWMLDTLGKLRIEKL